MTKMISVNIETNGYGISDPKDWANELSNVYADVELADLSILGNMILFKKDSQEWMIPAQKTSR